MATVKQLRARIKTSKSIQQITRAMKLVAAARLRKAQDRVVQARPYSEQMFDLMRQLGRAGELPEHPLLAKRPVEKAGVVVITSDRGLAGSYNSSLIRVAEEMLRQQEKDYWKLVTVGKKGTIYFSKRHYDVAESYSFAVSGASLDDASAVTERVRQMFETGEADAIYLVYSKFISPLRQTPTVMQLLPIEPPVTDDENAATVNYEFEPGPTELLGRLLPRYLLTLVYQSLLEATASEHGARMTAMTSASDNAGKMIRELTLLANSMRQAAITKEILEVVGGAEALAG